MTFGDGCQSIKVALHLPKASCFHHCFFLLLLKREWMSFKGELSESYRNLIVLLNKYSLWLLLLSHDNAVLLKSI